MRYFQENQTIPKSTVTGKAELRVVLYSEVNTDHESQRCVYSDDGKNFIKYDLSHDLNFEMREYESHFDLNDVTEIKKDKFNKFWLIAKYNDST